MGWPRFQGSAKAVTFARITVDEYCALHKLIDSNRKHAGRRDQRTVDQVRKVSAFTRGERLNFHVRAKMLTGIGQGVASAGIDRSKIDCFVRAIAVEALQRQL